MNHVQMTQSPNWDSLASQQEKIDPSLVGEYQFCIEMGLQCITIDSYLHSRRKYPGNPPQQIQKSGFTTYAWDNKVTKFCFGYG
jgi:hypothetical protein